MWSKAYYDCVSTWLWSHRGVGLSLFPRGYQKGSLNAWWHRKKFAFLQLCVCKHVLNANGNAETDNGSSVDSWLACWQLDNLNYSFLSSLIQERKKAKNLTKEGLIIKVINKVHLHFKTFLRLFISPKSSPMNYNPHFDSCCPKFIYNKPLV